MLHTRPLWSLQVIDLQGPFAWKALGGEALCEVLERLRQLESMTWGEIEGREHHFVDVAGCSREARERLQELRQDDTDALFSIRVTGRRRVFGIRDGSVLRLLWWDPEHAVYPSHKKHT